MKSNTHRKNEHLIYACRFIGYRLREFCRNTDNERLALPSLIEIYDSLYIIFKEIKLALIIK